MAIRDTYANFSSQKSLQFSWKRIFVVGSPRNEKEEYSLSLENKAFNDILVLNIAENYTKLSLKMLGALKFVGCFCPTAKYLVKTDDDAYINIAALDRMLVESEKQLEQKRTDLKVTTGIGYKKATRTGQNMKVKDEQPFYFGFLELASLFRPDTKKQVPPEWIVSYEEYSEDNFPPYMSGPLYIMSFSIVKELALDCPYTCTGLDPNLLERNLKKPCFWKFEDTLMGSCIGFTQRTTVFIDKVSSTSTNRWPQLSSLIIRGAHRELKVHKVKAEKTFYMLSLLFWCLEHLSSDHPIKKLFLEFIKTFN